MKGQNNCLYEFESFRLDPLKRQLLRDGQIVPLTSKAFTTLLILIEHRGKIVTKNKLMNAVWFDTAVEENNLTQQISALRKILGDQVKEHRFIATISGQGYNFIAPVREINFSAPEIVLQEITQSSITFDICDNEEIETSKGINYLLAGLGEPQQLQAYILFSALLLLSISVSISIFIYSYSNEKPTIAVLPFRPLDDNEWSSSHSLGIPSYITAKIGNLPNMIVRSAESTGEYYGQEQDVMTIGRKSNVDAVLTGSIQSEGNTVRVIAHLWDVKHNRQLWAGVFTRENSDNFITQDSISEEIISAVRTEFSN